MKTLLLSLVMVLSFSLVNGQTSKNYIEFNTGISTGLIPFFPGGSLLYGKTIIYESGIVLDYEGGVAFPSVVTGKIGLGCTIKNDAELTFGIRPWPATSYIQLELNRDNKRSNLIFSAEKMWGRDLFVQEGILTIGWRFSGNKYSDVRHSKR
jgi:hypothetical protein